MEVAICIMARKPELGRVKTRLAATVGDDFTLAAYQSMLTYTLNEVAGAGTVFVAYTPEPLDDCSYDQFPQAEGNLGQRLKHAAQELLAKGYQKLVFMGTDCVEFTRADVDRAVRHLDSSDFCIGPAHDGGYYLMALKPGGLYVFDEMPWSTGDLMAATTAAITGRGESYTLLETKSDIDEWSDLSIHIEHLGLQDRVPPSLNHGR
ncbi:MAG TPA: TIGR04282 family arsenosugar biosynthesis glycosyltransferase [Luteibaculaceae bacterium]|nr:TIGR04282 family arsenosugar biosynthesis glycosyltransferase [Luteibaculaceae bacterium]